MSVASPVAEHVAPPRVGGRGPWVGLLVAAALVVLCFVVPHVFGWQVHARYSPSSDDVAPLEGLWQPVLLGAGTIPSVLIALVGWRWASDVAERLSWRRLLVVSYAAGLAWLVSLAYVRGSAGISGILGERNEYLRTARSVTDVHALLQEYVSRIPLSAAPHNWPTHVAAHPPGALLFFVLLVHVGLGGDYAAGMVVTVIAASTSGAVLVTLRALGREQVARRAAPFLVLTPAAVFMAVSADALFAAVAAWGLACLALAATRPGRGRSTAWAVGAGLLLGAAVMMSYGLPLIGLVALAVLASARSWRVLPVVAGVALLVVLAFAAGGFEWWRAYPVLDDRYWDGIAAIRPAAYWMWGDLGALLLSGGLLLGAGIGSLAGGWRRTDRTLLLLVGAALAAILVADLSRMSKAETERIWLPFVPWLTLGVALLPAGWRRWGLGLQVVGAVVLESLIFTTW